MVMFQPVHSTRVEQVSQRGRQVFERITFYPQIMGGRVCIRGIGIGITVSQVLRLIATGEHYSPGCTLHLKQNS